MHGCRKIEVSKYLVILYNLKKQCLFTGMTSSWLSQEITSDYIRMTAERHPIYLALVALTTKPSIMDVRSMYWWGCVSLRCVEKARHKRRLSLCQCRAPCVPMCSYIGEDAQWRHVERNESYFGNVLRHHGLLEKFWWWWRALTHHSTNSGV